MVAPVLGQSRAASASPSAGDDGRASTASISWQPFPGPYGGNGSLFVTPLSALLFTNGSNMYRSVNKGGQWTESSQGIARTANSMNILGVYRGGNDVFTVAGALLYRSANDGITWQRLPTPLDTAVYSFAAHRSGALFVSGSGDASTRKWAAIYRSTNNGAGWVKLTDTLARGGELHVTRTGRLMSIDISDINGAYYTSTDLGATWAARPWPFSATTAFVMDSSGVLYASGSLPSFTNATIRSTDDGDTWSQLSNSLYSSMTVSPQNVLYGLGIAVYKSTTQGASWTQVKPMDQYEEASFNSLVGNGMGDLFLSTFLGVEALQNGSSAWVPANNGLSAQSITQMVKDSTGRLFARSYFGWKVYSSLDNGLSWPGYSSNWFESISSPQSMAVTALNTLLLGFSEKVYRSLNGGNTWAFTWLTRTTWSGCKLLPLRNGPVLMGTDSLVLRSTDDGVTWNPFSAGLPGYVPVNALFAAANGDAYCASEAGIFRLPSGGSAWQSLDTTGLPRKSALRLVANAANDLFVVPTNSYSWSTFSWSGNGIYKKPAAGGPWQRLTALGDTMITTLAVHAKTGQLFAATSRGTIRYSPDNGFTWEDASSGLPTGVGINALNFLGDSLLAVSTDGAGIFRSSFPVPVELLSFSAAAQSGGVDVQWRTAREDNVVGFQIERATEGRDRWDNISFLRGHGSSTQPAAYRYLDPLTDPSAFPARYRLKQIDADGSITYSPVITVELGNGTTASMAFDVLPNPVVGDAVLSVSLPRETDVDFMLYASNGRLVMSPARRTLPAGGSAFTITRGSLAAGTYFWVMTAADGTRQVRRMVLR